MLEQVAAIVTSVRPSPGVPLQPDTALIDHLGFTSLDVMNLILALEQRFEISFRDEDLDLDLIGAAKIVYLEGYLFDRDEAKAAFREAARAAKQAGAKVALTLSDAFCVDRHRDDFKALVREGADIVFANEREITTLYQVNSFEEAADAALQDCELAVLTRSEEGSVIVAQGETIEIPAGKVPQVVDVTGAGDLYSAGFLYGLTHGAPLEQCGRIGSLAAAEVISHLGPRPEVSLKDLVAERLR